MGVVLVALVLLVLPVTATLFALLDEGYTRQRRLLHVLLAWAIPVVGPLSAIYMTAKSPRLEQAGDNSATHSPDLTVGDNIATSDNDDSHAGHNGHDE